MKPLNRLVTRWSVFLKCAPRRLRPKESAEVDSFLEASLKQPPPDIETPASLHRSIMSAVRTSQIETAPRSAFHFRWNFLAPAGAALALAWLGLWYYGQLPGEDSDSTEPLNAGTVLVVGHRLTQELPVGVMLPLAEELQNLDNDLNRAQEVLLASLP